jgi:predicted Ser/Thr protein kinase
VVKVRVTGPSLEKEAETQVLCALYGAAPTVLDYSSDFIRMERVRGVELYKMLHEAHLMDQVRACREAGKALAKVHQSGVVHGDFHPRNVLIKHDGTAVVIDYGKAYYSDEEFEFRMEFGEFVTGSSDPVRKGTKLYAGIERWLSLKSQASRLGEYVESVSDSYYSC